MLIEEVGVGMAEQTTADDVDRIVNQIRAFAESIDDPDLWRILVPVESFDAVKERLDTEYDVGTYYQGIGLCYTQDFDAARVEYRADLADHMEDA